MKNILWILFLLLLSCSSPKQKFIKEYYDISTSIVENYQSFTDDDWAMALEQYISLRKDYFLFSAELTEREKERIHQLNLQVNQVLASYKIESTKSSVISIWEEVKSLFRIEIE